MLCQLCLCCRVIDDVTTREAERNGTPLGTCLPRIQTFGNCVGSNQQLHVRNDMTRLRYSEFSTDFGRSREKNVPSSHVDIWWGHAWNHDDFRETRHQTRYWKTLTRPACIRPQTSFLSSISRNKRALNGQWYTKRSRFLLKHKIFVFGWSEINLLFSWRKMSYLGDCNVQ